MTLKVSDVRDDPSSSDTSNCWKWSPWPREGVVGHVREFARAEIDEVFAVEGASQPRWAALPVMDRAATCTGSPTCSRAQLRRSARC